MNIPPKARQQFLEELLKQYSNTPTITNKTKLKIDWSQVKGFRGADMEKAASLQRANQQQRLVEWSRRVEACRSSGLSVERVRQQPLQGFHLVVMTVFLSLYDTHLQLFNRGLRLLPINGFPALCLVSRRTQFPVHLRFLLSKVL